MLTKEELSLNLRFLSMLSKLHLLPLTVDRSTGKIQVLKGHKTFSWFVLVGAAQLNIIFATGTFLLKVRNGYEKAFESVSFDFLFTFPCEYTLLVGIWTFMKWSQQTAVVFNSCLSSSKHGHDRIRLRRSVRVLSLLQLLTIGMPDASERLPSCCRSPLCKILRCHLAGHSLPFQPLPIVHSEYGGRQFLHLHQLYLI